MQRLRRSRSSQPDAYNFELHKKIPVRFGAESSSEIAIGGAVRQMRTSLQYPYPALGSGRQKAAPLGESGGAGQLVVVSVLHMAFRRKVIVHRGMD